MIFTELVLENFGPYIGRQVINLRPEVDDPIRPIILFGGMNGGGKTTLMDAIRLALYGQRAQCSTRVNLGYGDFLSQCVNRHTSPLEHTRVELAFEHIQDDKWVELRIVRYWTKDLKEGKDTLGILEWDGKQDYWKDEYLTNTWDEYIENLLPLGISNLFLFDGEQVKELAEQDVPPPLVVEAIESMLGLELAERLSIDLEILVRRKRKNLANAKQLASLEEIEQRLSHYNREYEEAKQDLASLKNQVEQAEKKHKEAYDKFLSEGGKIAAEQTQLETEKRNIAAKIERSRLFLVELSAGIFPLFLIQSLLTDAEKQGEKEVKRQQVNIAYNLVKKRWDRLLYFIKQLDLDPEQIDKIDFFIDQEYQELRNQISSEGEDWLSAEEETLNFLTTVLRHELPNQVKQAMEKLEEIKSLEIELIATERQIAAAPSPEIYEQLKAAVNTTQRELVKAQANYENGQRRLVQLEEAIKKTKKELSDYSEASIERHNDEHIIAASAKVQQTLKLFRERLTLRKLTKLEKEVTDCFRYLLHKSDLVHRVVIDTANFSLSLYDTQGQTVPKHRLSAGEKQLLAIAFLWGLARVSGRHLPVAIDTPLGRLDSEHRQNLVDRYFPSASHQVILLSTDTEIGEVEVQRLRQQEAIAREYLLKYDSANRQTTVEEGYFW